MFHHPLGGSKKNDEEEVEAERVWDRHTHTHKHKSARVHTRARAHTHRRSVQGETKAINCTKQLQLPTNPNRCLALSNTDSCVPIPRQASREKTQVSAGKAAPLEAKSVVASRRPQSSEPSTPP